VVVAIDARRDRTQEGRWCVFTYGGRHATDLDAVTYAVQAEGCGAGEILLTSMDEDGRKTGYDLELLAAVTKAVSVPVIASGGAGSARHLIDAVQVGGADAVLAASVFHFDEMSVGYAKRAMAAAGIPVRLSLEGDEP